jgi:uncharacterized protein YkvS
MTYKSDRDIINDALMARVRELEAHQDGLTGIIEKLNVKEYLLSQYIFINRVDLLNGFAKFVEDNYKECAHNYGYNGIEQQVVDMLKDLADDIDKGDKNHYSELFMVLSGLQVTK